MLAYSGGTLFDPYSNGYSFSRNFFSDLGRIEGFSGNINYIPAIFFNMSLIIAGIVFVIFYINTRNIFVEYNHMGLAMVGSLFGVLAGISLAGVGLSPADLFLPLHIVSAKWLFRCFFGASICYSIIIYRSNIFGNKYALGYLMFACSILAYIFISEFGPSPKESELSLTIQVISQKIIVLILLSAVYIQTVGLQKLRR